VAGESLSERVLTGLRPGSLVAGYRVESRIGAGGMAMVFRARDEKLGRTVALKIVTPALAGDREFRERFDRESRAVAAVDHPHIIPVYAAGEANGVLYLAMRFISGGDLRSIVRREGPLSGDRAITLLFPIASALDAAHRAGLLHRDVKPANILIDGRPGRPEHPYLSDFGLAKGTMSAAAGLTETGQFVGTPDYAAPEQISGRPIRPQTDQYALACVAYTILTGALPFGRRESVAVLWGHMYDSPPALTVRRPDLPATADSVLARALAKAPEDRYATCGEFTHALRDALSAAHRAEPRASFGSARPPAEGTWPRPADRRAQATYPQARTVAPHPMLPAEPERSAAR
jgi:serine/threonine protein kinase